MKRYLHDQVVADLAHKMVFVGGPRQVGKTTMAKAIEAGAGGYLNWDIPEQRKRILRRTLPDAPLWVFDEIHKYRRWRNYLKGVFDQFSDDQRILVTGSARLDLYRFGGDSLQGRYYYLRLHPLSFFELGGRSQQDLEALFRLGGFPEPFLAGSEKRARRWSNHYRDRLIRDEIASLENLRDLGLLEELMLALPERVGSPLSVNGLREDLQLNHQTVSRWLDIFERTYAIFRLLPFGAPRLRAVKKERKHYHMDWTVIDDEGARFENLMAAQLLKWTHYLCDTDGRQVQLCYFRDHDRREVDFVLAEKKKPIMLVECKLSAGPPTRGLRYLAQRFPKAEAYQVHYEPTAARVSKEGIRLWPATKFLLQLI